jgi:penicillin G amidase
MLGMHALLTWSGDQERTATVMPPSVVDFLTPERDCYSEQLAPRSPARCAGGGIPTADLINVLKVASGLEIKGEDIVSVHGSPNGSNAWVVGPVKTRDGRTILANDMHLDLSVPNIWYRAEVHYPGASLSGLTLPGLPLLIAVSNGRLAWGLTNVEGDFADLVSLEEDPESPNRYLTPAGLISFETRNETIHIRGGADETLKVRTTIWGPVLPEPLLGREVAAHWTALDPASTDLGISGIASATTVASAIALVHRAGGPPLNVVLADGVRSQRAAHFAIESYFGCTRGRGAKTSSFLSAECRRTAGRDRVQDAQRRPVQSDRVQTPLCVALDLLVSLSYPAGLRYGRHDVVLRGSSSVG